jgi:hypothetical protein
MTTIYSNIPQTISSFIPQLNKTQVVSVQTVDKDKNIIYRSFKVYSFPNAKAKDIRLVELGAYSEVYKASSYYQITQEFIVNTYSTTQEIINNVLQPSFYTWENTTTYINSNRQLGNSERLVVTWTPTTTGLTAEEISLLTPQQIESYLQPFSIQVGDVYGVTIPPNCQVISPTNLNTNLLIDVNIITIKPLALVPLMFSFRGVDVVSIELPYKIITDNPKLIYSKSIIDPPKVPPTIEGLRTDFPDVNETELANYAIRRSRPTAII